MNKLIKVSSVVFTAFLISFFPSLVFAENVSVIGVGRLGLSLALCLEKAGYNVLGVDVSPSYVELLNMKSLISPEPEVTNFLQKSNNFIATTSLEKALDFSDICFVVVSTTRGTDGYAFDDMTALLEEISKSEVTNKHIVICSTVTPGYITSIKNRLFKDSSNTISYNPEFIAQGSIINGLLNPDMVLIGEGSKEAGDKLSYIYQQMCHNTPYIARMGIESAEITKLALNCFVTAKIAFANLVADIADETPGADKYVILNAIGKDSRVGSKYFSPGYSFGGPCFVRDNRAFTKYAPTKGIEPTLFACTDRANDDHSKYMARKMAEQNLDEYVFEDVSYKPNCPVKIIEASAKLIVAKYLVALGKNVTIIDTEEVIDLVQAEYGDIFNYKTLKI